MSKKLKGLIQDSSLVISIKYRQQGYNHYECNGILELNINF